MNNDDPVSMTSSSSDESEPEPTPAIGLPTVCACGVPPVIGTETHFYREGDRYLWCFYDKNEGENKGCGLKKYLEDTFLEEFHEIKKNKTQTEKLLKVANEKIEDLEIEVGSLAAQYEDFQAKYEDMQAKYKDMQAKYEEMVQKFRFLHP